MQEDALPGGIEGVGRRGPVRFCLNSNVFGNQSLSDFRNGKVSSLMFMEDPKTLNIAKGTTDPRVEFILPK